MDPSVYVPAYLEKSYLDTHPDLTSAARELLHDEIPRDPARYATDELGRGLIEYMNLHGALMRELARMEELPDAEFDRARTRLATEVRGRFASIAREHEDVYDAQLVEILLSDASCDALISDLLKLEGSLEKRLAAIIPGFDPDAPRNLDEGFIRTCPELICWLHVEESLSQECLASARHRPAIRYARRVVDTPGYPSLAIGTLLLALARLEDEDGFFEAARSGGESVEGLPWFGLARTLLLYKKKSMRSARRALRDFATRFDGGAFFLLNPTYHAPYLPSRPAPRTSWEQVHQAVWEADSIIADTPDFPAWAEGVEGISELSEDFAARNGF